MQQKQNQKFPMTLTLRWKTISHFQIWCARVQQKGQAFRSNIEPFTKKYSSSLSAHSSWSNLCFMSWQKEGAVGKVLPELWRLLHRPRLSNSLIKKQNKTQQCMCREQTGRRQHFPHSSSGCGAALDSTTASKLEVTAGRSHRQLTDVILPGW